MSIIFALDESTRKRVQSTQDFTSISSIVEQLLLNSIDAGSTVIEIRYSISGFNVNVDDNGEGIDFDNLKNVGKQNHTSKIKSGDEIDRVVTYGFRGIMLHSLSQICKLEISSRARTSFQSYRKNVANDFLPVACSRHIGTTVQCSELFMKFMVRRKYISSHSSQEHEKLISMIQKYSFVHPRINIILKHEHQTIFIKRPIESRKELLRYFTHRVLKVRRSEDENFLVSTLKPVNFFTSNKTIQIQGFLSETSVFPTNQYQWLFINRRIIDEPDFRRIFNVKYRQKRSKLKESNTRQHPVYFLNIVVSNYPNNDEEEDSTNLQQSQMILKMSSYSFERRTFYYQKKKVLISTLSELVRSFFDSLSGRDILQKRKQAISGESNQNNNKIENQVMKPPPSSNLFSNSRHRVIGNSSRPETRKFATKMSVKELIQKNLELNPVYQRKGGRNSYTNLMERTKSQIVPPPPPSRNNMISSSHHFPNTTSNLKKLTISREVKITKEVLSQMTVMNQVDRKFILVKSNEFVFVIDQHAADERIQLEKLENETYDFLHSSISNEILPKKNSSVISPYIVHNEKPFKCDFLKSQVLRKNLSFLKSWFWELRENNSFSGKDDASTNNYSSQLLKKKDSVRENNQNSVVHLTTFNIIQAPKVCDVMLGGAELSLFLEQLSHGGGKGGLPIAVQNILGYKACRSAVKFGDFLSMGKCREIMMELKNCRLPFQCAHGRPSIQPLFNY